MSDKDDKFSIIDKGMTVDGSVVGRGNLVVNGTLKATFPVTVWLSVKRGASLRRPKPGP